VEGPSAERVREGERQIAEKAVGYERGWRSRSLVSQQQRQREGRLFQSSKAQIQENSRPDETLYIVDPSIPNRQSGLGCVTS
jgi:hypothetical protein